MMCHCCLTTALSPQLLACLSDCQCQVSALDHCSIVRFITLHLVLQLIVQRQTIDLTKMGFPAAFKFVELLAYINVYPKAI